MLPSHHNNNRLLRRRRRLVALPTVDSEFRPEILLHIIVDGCDQARIASIFQRAKCFYAIWLWHFFPEHKTEAEIIIIIISVVFSHFFFLLKSELTN